jgi:hypothetical protein
MRTRGLINRRIGCDRCTAVEQQRGRVGILKFTLQVRYTYMYLCHNNMHQYGYILIRHRTGTE